MVKEKPRLHLNLTPWVSVLGTDLEGRSDRQRAHAEPFSFSFFLSRLVDQKVLSTAICSFFFSILSKWKDSLGRKPQ